MSDSKKVKGYFLDENKSRGKKNVKDLNRERKFNWRGKIDEEENEEAFEYSGRNNKSY
jgi:hypothetical protein